MTTIRILVVIPVLAVMLALFSVSSKATEQYEEAAPVIYGAAGSLSVQTLKLDVRPELQRAI